MYLPILESLFEDISVRKLKHIRTGFIAPYTTDLNDLFTIYWCTIFRALSFSVLTEKADVIDQQQVVDEEDQKDPHHGQGPRAIAPQQ